MPVKTYMLDTCICSFIQREQPELVLKRLQQTHAQHHRIVVSAITYAEMQFGATSRKASKKHIALVNAFLTRLDAILPWDAAAVDKTAIIKRQLSDLDTPIGPNDSGSCTCHTSYSGH